MLAYLFKKLKRNNHKISPTPVESWQGLQPLEPRLLLDGSQTYLADLLPANGGDGSFGFVATGINAGDQSGYSAKSAGDINGDAVEDLVIGAPSAGEVYIVYGSSDGFSATVNLEDLNGTNGLRLVGNSAEQAGFSVSSAGDMNNDGFDDLIIGAPASDPAATSCDVDNTVGLNICDAGAAPGFTLFSPSPSTDTYLIDNDGLLVNSWSSPNRGALSSYLLEDGSLLRTGKVADENTTFDVAGAGGEIEIQDWDGNQTWLYEYSSDTGTDQYLHHHDVERLSNGNVLVIAWELKTQAQAVAAGRDPDLLNQGELWPEKIIEVQKTGATTGNIVWEWNVWDHLIQDFDNTKANFGVVGDNPQLVDINYTLNSNSDWLHANGIDYNASLDQIVLSVHHLSEIWVIDHSTTTAQAAAHTGGTSGKGGDLLYRWGNPQAYDAGVAADRKLFLQHDARWLETGLPGADNIMIFNNGQGRPAGDASSVEEITPPLNIGNNNNYDLTPGSAYGPETTVFTYPTPLDEDFFAQNVSGAHRLPNGNTLITNGPAGEFREINSSGTIVWDYINPVSRNGALDQGEPATRNMVFRATKYDPSFPGFNGKDLAPGDVIEGGTLADRVNAGSAYVVLGSASLPATLNLYGLNGTNGFRLNGAVAGDGAGTSVTGAGDVNNDGFDDVMIGATGADPGSRADAGSAYVVLGAASFAQTMELSSLNGANGFRLDGATAGDEFGLSVSAAGNVNNDNFDDMLIGAPGADPNGQSAAGSAYVVFGAANFSGATDVSTLNGTSGFRLDGVDTDDRAGQSVAGDGDVNGDGFSDVITGSPRAQVDGVAVGAAYVFLGKTSGFAPSVSLGGLNGATGFRLAGDYESDPLLSSFIVNTTGLESHDIAGQNTDVVENALVNFTTVIPDDNSVYAHSSGIPAEVIGPWPGPNTVTDQDRTHQFPRLPIEQSNIKTETELGSTGVWIDGVAIFNWSDARSYRNRGVWNQNAIHFEGPNLDSCGAHPPPFGEYHTHATPDCLMDRMGDDGSKHSPILGWSYDGFPIYGPWGYANADGSGDLERLESSWRVRDITVRTHYADGSDVADGPTLSTAPLGAYLEDYEYVDSLGDLDQHNGHFSVTPEYPQGVYHYHVSTDASGVGVFPYVIGVEYYGVVETANTAGQGGNVGDPAAADIYVSYIRDHNGDGFDDAALGDPDGYVSGSQVAGTTHVIYGKASTFNADTHLHSLDGTNGFHVEGIDDHDHAGYAIGSADLNGDGGDDLIIGAHDADPSGDSAAGETFVIFGSHLDEDLLPPVISALADLELAEDGPVHMTGPDLSDHVSDQYASASDIQLRIANFSEIGSDFGLTIGMDSGSGSFANRIDNTIHVHPSQHFNGSMTVTIEARDPAGNVSDPQSFILTITPVNDPPTASDDAPPAVDEDSGVTNLDVLFNDATAPDTGEMLTVIAADTTGSQGGTITIVSGGASLDYQPAANFFGTETFSYTINDGTPGSNDSATVTMTVNPGDEVASISGTNYQDLDGDGVKDQDEPGLEGWTIQLQDGNDQLITTATTNVNGDYGFDDLDPGTYRVREVQQAGWLQTTVDPDDVTVVSGQNVNDINLGNFELVTITGMKYQDQDGDGVKDQDEPGLSGWTIQLQDGNGQLITTATTDVNGDYGFDDLGPGTYRVREVLQQGWAQTTADPDDLTVVSGQDVNDIDFGNFELMTIAGMKYEDHDGDGEKNDGEVGLEGWTIQLLDPATGGVLGETHTLGDGTYSFSNLGPVSGAYRVREVLQDRWVQTTTNPSDVAVSSGDDITDIDFGSLALVLDIDGSGAPAALTDGLLIMRYLAGFRGQALISDAVAPDATRTAAWGIETFLQETIPVYGDVDDSGSVMALTDGLLIIRFLAGFTGTALVADATAGPRSDPADIVAFLNPLLAPPVQQGSAGPADAQMHDVFADVSPLLIQFDENRSVRQGPVAIDHTQVGAARFAG